MPKFSSKDREQVISEKAGNSQLNYVQFSLINGLFSFQKNQFFFAMITMTSNLPKLILFEKTSQICGNYLNIIAFSLMKVQMMLIFHLISITDSTMLNALLLLTSIGSVTSYTSNSCFSGCQTCEIIFFFIYCTQCSSSRNYNITTGLCDCVSGTYDTGSSCQTCPYYCQTCNNQSCLTCSADKYLDPFTKRCLCSNGKDYDSQGSCDTSSINYSLIVGIAVGVSLGLSCLLTVIYMIRRRNFRIFDRDDSPREVAHHQPRQNHHIVVEAFGNSEDSSAFSIYPQSKHTSKKFQFKEENCSICLEDNPFFMTECGHFFHEQCITVWLKKRGSCPNCNQVIELMRVRKWCNLRKKQLIYPQRFRLVTMKKAAIKESPPIFWPSCSQCQGIHNGIDLQSLK